MNKIFSIGEPVWIPSSCMLYYPNTTCPNAYKLVEKPICAWFVEKTDDRWAKVMFENIYWSIEQKDLFPYPQE